MNQVSQAYIMGIKEGRALLQSMGAATREDILAILENIKSTLASGFSGDVGDMLRGERDFWKNQLAKKA